jgi:hypothetical protein
MRGGCGCGVVHAGATRIRVAVVITAGHGRSPLKVLLAPLLDAFDALLGVVNGDVEQRFLIATWCHLPASLCRAKHDRLVAGGALGGDAMRLLKRALEVVTMYVLSWALCTALKQCAHATLASLAANLGLVALTLLPS